MTSPCKGDRVVIELHTSDSYEGTIERISGTCIELYDITCLNTNASIAGTLAFFRAEVKSLVITSNSVSSSSSISNGDIQDDLTKTILLHQDEYVRLRKMIDNHTFIDSRNNPAFADAVRTLSDRESIGVVTLGHNFNRMGKLSLLVLSDFKQVFVFDVRCLGGLRGLDGLITNEYIKKVVYAGGAAFDTFYKKYDIEMVNIFDIQISETILDPKLKTTNIGESLFHHFGIPLSHISTAIDYFTDGQLDQRPLTISDKKKAALLGTYLISLKDHLVEKMLEKHTKAVQEEYEKFKAMSDMEAILWKNKKINGF